MSDNGHPDLDNRGSDTDLSSMIGRLQNVSQIPSKQRKTLVPSLVRDIASKAYLSGLPTEDLTALVDVLTKPNHIDQTSLTTLIKNLYPSSKVPSSLIAKIVCSLGPGRTKPTHATQTLLLQWIVLVYEVLEDPSCLSRLYRTLFNHLDMLTLRRPLCHLLCLITRRKHVKPYRIQALLELQQNSGDEASLGSLIRVYKDYYPDIIVADVRGKRWNRFMSQDYGSLEHLRIVQAANVTGALGVIEELDAQSSFKVVRRGAKRSRVSVIPEVRTNGLSEGSTTLEAIENVEDFINHLETLELPNQIVSVIQDPLAMKLLKIRSDKVATLRLEEWLRGFFNETSRNEEAGDEDQAVLDHVLDTLLVYVRYMKAMPTALEVFLRDYIQGSNGKISQTILELLAYLSIREFDVLRLNFLDPLEAKTINLTPESRSTLLDFYGSLLVQWTNKILSVSSSNPQEVMPSPLHTTQLVGHASTLALSMLETSRRRSEDAVLSFFATLARIFSFAPKTLSIRISLLPPRLVYLLAFTNNLSTISRLCSILTTYKQAYEASMKASREPASEIATYPLADVNTFNGCVMDVCNLLWRNRALNQQDQDAAGCLVSPNLHAPAQRYLDTLGENLSLMVLYSLSYHAGFSPVSAACLLELQEIENSKRDGGSKVRLEGPANPKSLGALEKRGGLALSWQNYRLEMLQWLDERGSEGVGRLMRNTMKILRQHGA